MDYVLTGFLTLDAWLEAVTPRGALVVLPLAVLAWLVAWRWSRFRDAAPVAAALIRLWGAMLGVACAAMLLAWLVGTRTDGDPHLYWHGLSAGNVLALVALAAPAHALRSTLALLLAPAAGGGSRLRDGIIATAWVLFAGIMLLCLHGLLMSFAFPWGGGEFHSMFAYSGGGSVEAAWYTWRASVLILGVCATLLSGWVPVRWWVLALLACVVGVEHWWDVYTWKPQSREFHRIVAWLLFALPMAILLLSGAGAWLRSRWSTQAALPGPPRLTTP